jgi:hypothetical protein
VKLQAAKPANEPREAQRRKNVAPNALRASDAAVIETHDAQIEHHILLCNILPWVGVPTVVFTA